MLRISSVVESSNDDAALSEWSKMLANWLRVQGVVK
jgi:hypothetical protein